MAERIPAVLRRVADLIVVVVLAQIALGGLVAGLRAGQSYNTWPLMNGRFVPPLSDLGFMEPAWRNVVDNITTVQFQHRMTAYTLLALALLQVVWTVRVAPGTAAARRAGLVLGLVAAQACLGILTLVLVVPIWAGLLHQLFAMVVLTAVVVHRQRLGATQDGFARAPPRRVSGPSLIVRIRRRAARAPSSGSGPSQRSVPPRVPSRPPPR